MSLIFRYSLHPEFPPASFAKVLFHSWVDGFIVSDIKDTVRGATGSNDLQENSELPLSPENMGYITSNNMETSKRMPVEDFSTMLVDSYQFPHVLEHKNGLSFKEEPLTSSGGTQRGLFHLSLC